MLRRGVRVLAKKEKKAKSGFQFKTPKFMLVFGKMFSDLKDAGGIGTILWDNRWFIGIGGAFAWMAWEQHVETKRAQDAATLGEAKPEKWYRKPLYTLFIKDEPKEGDSVEMQQVKHMYMGKLYSPDPVVVQQEPPKIEPMVKTEWQWKGMFPKKVTRRIEEGGK
eukprot:TRINITY_DN94207_c0_g1_i1.p1 TRINITY_DN94207_c0_g1~~TRINITY_DN94207_c0_g1_i1.p1  ORF type:complete len:185 (+),score=29.92 TRINITY_DN94207_c0_g1_i1:63-557(+)